MKTIFFLFISCSLQALSIVFVHVGNSPLPEHLVFSISQARAFNATCPIYLIAPDAALKAKGAMKPYEGLNISSVPCESLPQSAAHQKFRSCKTHVNTVDGFWIWTSERFFYLDELIRAKQLTDVFHLENDVMLYLDLEAALPVFHKHYPGMIAATFEKDDRCVPGFLYIANTTPMEKLANSFPRQIGENTTDMETLARFKDQHRGTWIDFLPITLPAYISTVDPAIFKGKAASPKDYTHHFDEFHSIFDAAAFGVYLAGWDAKQHAECHPGTVSPRCIFNASHFTVEWDLDAKGRRVPFAKYQDVKVRINN